METENVSDRSNNISVSIALQSVMDRYGTDQKAIQYDGNIVLISYVYTSNDLFRIQYNFLFNTNLKKRTLKKLKILVVKQYSRQTRNYINRLMTLV